MLLIKDIIEVDNTHAITRSIVDTSWPLIEKGHLHPLVLVELAAQTAGVCNGWDRIQTLGMDSNQMGWLVGIKKTTFSTQKLSCGTTVITRAETTHDFGNLREISSTVLVDGTIICQTTLQLFQEQ